MKDNEMKMCQSCGIPLSRDGLQGTNADNSKSDEYCNHCYKNGSFVRDETMEEFIETCVPYVSKGNPYLNEDAARKALNESFPKLKRWKA